MKAVEPITVFFIEDNAVVRMALSSLIDQTDQFELVGCAEEGQTGVEQVLKLRPAVVLMDIKLPKKDGLEATRQIKAALPNTGVLIFSSCDNHEEVREAIMAQADGFCPRNAEQAELLKAIRTVGRGGHWLSPELTDRVLKASMHVPSNLMPAAELDPPQREPELPELTKQERKVLKLVVNGLSNQEIAESLASNIETVKTHLHHIIKKLGVSNRTQAAIEGLKRGIK